MLRKYQGNASTCRELIPQILPKKSPADLGLPSYGKSHFPFLCQLETVTTRYLLGPLTEATPFGAKQLDTMDHGDGCWDQYQGIKSQQLDIPTD